MPCHDVFQVRNVEILEYNGTMNVIDGCINGGGYLCNNVCVECTELMLEILGCCAWDMTFWVIAPVHL